MFVFFQDQQQQQVKEELDRLKGEVQSLEEERQREEKKHSRKGREDTQGRGRERADRVQRAGRKVAPSITLNQRKKEVYRSAPQHEPNFPNLYP